MANFNNRLIVVLGPTATGKSDFAVQLAKKIGGEIISADSRQIYKGMDIGTGKITKKEMRGIPHHLLDIASPKTNFNVEKFKKSAQRKISEIHKKNKVPILVGGTGFWIEAVIYDQKFPEVKPNQELRKQISNYSTEQLFKILHDIDPGRAESIDPKNKHRLIRAIEIAKSGIKLQPLNYQSPYDITLIGLDLPKDQLNQRIEKRLDARLRSGMIKEVQNLHDQGISWKRLESFGLEYKFIALYLQGRLNRQQMRDQLLSAIRAYAKRQRTWFKRNKKITWYDPGDPKILNLF